MKSRKLASEPERAAAIMERRLAAIMALDVVGYSRLMEKDEAGTLEALRAFRTTILNPIVEQHGGRIFKHTGDGALIEFASAIDAVNSACEIQRELLLKAAPAEADQLRLRIGINLGDVVIEDGDIYGDGVNVAARLEGIAQADAIYVSGAVYEISNKMLPCRFVFVGSKHLKNISVPVRVYRVEAATGSHLPSIKTLDKRHIVGLAILAALATAAVVVLYPAWLSPQRSFPPVASSSMAYPLPVKPSLALLAFHFHSPDAMDALIARGLSADVRQRLSERGDLFVIAEHSSFQLPSTLGPAEIARRFGIRYVLSGDYKRDGDNASLDAHLSDALAGDEIWEQRIDLPADRLSGVSESISTSVLAALKLDSAAMDRSSHAPGKRFEAWMLHLRAENEWLQATPEHNAAARQLWQQAQARDRSFLLALLMIGWTEWADARFGWREDWFGALDRAERDAQTVLASGSFEGSARELMASIYLQRMDHPRALEFARQAVAADPNRADAWARLAMVESYAGNPADALKAAETAMRLNPYYPPWYLMPAAEAYRLEGQYDRAISTALEEIRAVDSAYARLRLAVYFAHAGNREQALDQVRFARKAWPTLTISDWGWQSRFKDQKLTDSDRTILSALGVPEFMTFECLTRNQCP
jgi:adenylate cyclase